MAIIRDQEYNVHMDPGVPVRLRELQQQDEDFHLGLDAAQAISVPEKSNLELYIDWARNGILQFGIKLNSRNYRVLLDGIEAFEIVKMNERQHAMRYIFAQCLANSQGKPTETNDITVYPTAATKNGQ